MTQWDLVWDEDAWDYYAGAYAALYKDDRLVWQGSSCDAAERLVSAIVGRENMNVHRFSMRYLPRENLSDYNKATKDGHMLLDVYHAQAERKAKELTRKQLPVTRKRSLRGWLRKLVSLLK